MTNKNASTATFRSNTDVKFLYIRETHSAPRPGTQVYYESDRVVTIASRWNKKRTKMHYQVAVCMPTRRYLDNRDIYQKGDEFSRRLGRTIALGRLNANPQKVEFTEKFLRDGHRGHKTLEAHVLQNALSNPNIPLSARKAIAKHIKLNGLVEIDTADVAMVKNDSAAAPREALPRPPRQARSEADVKEFRALIDSLIDAT